MSKIKCIIVEDEPLAVKVLVDYVSQVPFLDLKGHILYRVTLIVFSN